MNNENFELRRTIEEIKQVNLRPESVFGLLRLINRFEYRNWNIEILCPISDLEIHISSDPELSYDDFRLICDGYINQIFKCEKIIFGNSSHCIEINLNQNTDGNSLKYLKYETVDNGILKLINFNEGVIPSDFHDKLKLEDYLSKFTWFGSVIDKRLVSSKKVNVKRLGTDIQIENVTRNNEYNPAIQFQKQIFEQLDDAPLQIDYSFTYDDAIIKTNLNYYHKIFGKIQNKSLSDTIISNFGKKNVCAVIEFSYENIQYDSDGQVGPSNTLEEISRVVKDNLEDIITSKDVKNFNNQIDTERKRLQANKLIKRQNELESRKKLNYGDTYLGCVPNSEMEVVVLTSKLEGYDGILPFSSFEICEYTSREGIDALANIQIENTNQISVAVPIEFEFYFESFFAHKHPCEQVFLIICWDVNSEQIKTKYDFSVHKPGLYKSKIENSDVWVLLLSELFN